MIQKKLLTLKILFPLTKSATIPTMAVQDFLKY